MTRQEAAIISAYTGTLVGEYDDLKAYAEEKLGPLTERDLKTPSVFYRIKAAAIPDFRALEVA